jgi:hypothetical protein
MPMKSIGRSIQIVLLFLFAACQGAPAAPSIASLAPAAASGVEPAAALPPARRNSVKLIHVLVALCDNKFQGIVPVPARIGDGDDPANNLYWGAAFGVKSYFKKSQDWKQIPATSTPKPAILERLIFKHQTRDVYLIADAYRGREIKLCVADFFAYASGRNSELVRAGSIDLHAGGGSDLIAYVGHDGLMDFVLDSHPQKADERRRDAVMLACVSKRYFAEALRKTGANPLLWTTGLMAPEAYVLKAAVDGWVLNEDGEKIRSRAAAAYNQYQRCGMGAASRLFSTGW